ncbi:MAG: M23 family metallopeptidase [Clostridiales bacterium]|nr:M23 family metallopeptidase [Clostridiales bacterium]
MSQEKKTHKRKILLRYLILAGCILLIAAITVITVCAVNDWFRPQLSADVTKPVDPVDPVEPDKPTDTDVTAANPVSNMDVTREYEFGLDVSLCNSWRYHKGMDMAAKVGDKVVACLDGTVEEIKVGDRVTGTTVTISHEGGIVTIYRFVDVKEGLKKGDKVKRGDQIGTVSESCGNEFKQEPHLHFEVKKNGKNIDPAEFLEIENK